MVAIPEKLRGAPYHAYGDGAQIFAWLDGSVPAPQEALYEGVAGCGKTRMIGQWIKAVCNMYPKSKGLVLRETRVSLNESFLDIWENEVLGPDHPAVLNGPSREHRQKYSHPSLGGEVILGGFDNPTKLFSTQYNWIYFNEAQETTKEKWESLHRALRRQGTPFRVLIGDCNPEEEDHFLNRRCEKGTCLRIVGRFWDNPTLYDHEKGEWREFGREYLKRLRTGTSGVRYQRLYLAKWVSATGAVWENFDRGVHMLTGTLEQRGLSWYLHVVGWDKPVELRWFLGSQDIGFDAPGCFQCWGLDSEGRMYRIVEVYRRRWDHDQWARVIEEVYKEFPMRAVLCDHDPAFISNLNKRLCRERGMPAIAREWTKTRAKGEEKCGIDLVRVRLKAREDGTRGIYFLRDALRHRDQELVDEERPWCTEMEIPSWVYPVREDGKPIKDEPDPGCADHGCDATRGAATFAFMRDLSGPVLEPPAKTLKFRDWQKELTAIN